MSFGEYLKQLRKEKDLSQRELAEKSGISNAEISRIETGGRQKISPDILRAIAPILGTPYEELMDKAGYLNRPNPLVEHSAAEAKFIEIVTPKLVLDGWSVELIRKGPSNILAKRDKEEWHLAFKNFRTHEDIVSYAIREEFRARDLLWRTYGRLVTYDNDNLTKFTLATANEIMYKAILNNIPKFLKLSVSAMLIDLQTGKILEEQTLT